jgi:hypothetical protein
VMLPVSESAHVDEVARPWEPGSCRKESASSVNLII